MKSAILILGLVLHLGSLDSLAENSQPLHAPQLRDETNSNANTRRDGHPQQEGPMYRPGLRVRVEHSSKTSVQDDKQIFCTLFLTSRTQLDSGECRYRGGGAAHCLRQWDSKNIEMEFETLHSDRLRSVSDAKVKWHPDYTAQKNAGGPFDLGYVEFVAACESQRDLPIWEMAHPATPVPPDSVALLLLDKGILAGVTRAYGKPDDSRFYIDTDALATGVPVSRPDLMDSGTGVLVDNKIVGVGISVPESRTKGGMLAASGEPFLWLYNLLSTSD